MKKSLFILLPLLIMSCSSNQTVIISNPHDIDRGKESIVVGTIEIYLSVNEDGTFPDNYFQFSEDPSENPLNIKLSNTSKSFKLICKNKYPTIKDPHEKLILKFYISAICEPEKYSIYSPNILAAVAPGAPRKSSIIRTFNVLPNTIINLGKTQIFLRETSSNSSNYTVRGLDLLSPTYNDYLHTPYKVSYDNSIEDNEALEVFSIDYPKIYQSYDLKLTTSSLTTITPRNVTNKDLADVCFTEKNNGTAVGWSGTILRTTDGGDNWAPIESGTTKGLLSVHFTDINNGTVVGTDGTILHTTDGGKTWESQTSGTKTYLSSVFFTNSDNGTIVHWMGSILHTTNGGQTWAEQPCEHKGGFFGVYFSDINHGTVVGDEGKIFHTTNGGGTWISQTSGTTKILNKVHLTNANNGTIVGSDGTILRTTDGGNIWVQLESGTDYDLTSVCFTDTNNGIVVGERGTILHTTDGGKTWDVIKSGTKYNLNSIFFLDSKHGVIVGDGGTILRTTDGGKTFTDRI
ncbi:MAG: YCF48-related protein [Ignavibacteriales bacterium]|nr:YCF48-related protein [Ignavibacteriales bacterium]